MLRLLPVLYLLLTSASAFPNCTPPFRGYRFLDPSLLEYDSQLGPIYASFAATYGQIDGQDAEASRRDNVQEWYERYCEQVELADVESLIYGDTRSLLESILKLAQRDDADASGLSSTLRKNSFARHLVDYRCLEVIRYLIYAKRAEPYVRRTPNGFKRRQSDRVAMERLLDEGLDVFKSVESHYVRLRYAYQFLRLAHYLKEYDYLLELYDYLMPKVQANSSLIYDWIEGHRAGALQARGDYATSAYLYSRIFERCASKRESAYLSFRIKTDEQWRAAINLCANDHERAMLHVLRAQNPRAVVLEELENIYTLEPDNHALEPLVMRELLELEKDLLGLDFNPNARRNQRFAKRPRRNAANRLVQLQAFVNRAVDEGKTANPKLWLLARGTLEMLAGDYFYARTSWRQLARADLPDTLTDQLDILREVTNVLALNQANDSVEIYYFELLNDEDLRTRFPSLRPLVNDKLEAVYRANGQSGKAALLQYGFDAIQKNPTLSYVQEMEGMADSLLGNRFDRALLADRVGPTPIDDINDLLGTFYLHKGRWKAALEVFKRVPAARRDAYGVFAPFDKQFRDKVNYSPSAKYTRFSKVDLLERLLELETQAERTTNDTIAARNFFNIGLAFYSMSYYSYNWRMADYFRSGSSGLLAARTPTYDWRFAHPEAPLGNHENMDMKLAAEYFARALERSPVRERAAEAAYFAAKAQRNGHYAAGSPGPRPFSYFRLLRDVYSDTEYYRRVVAECRTFAWYVGK